MDATSTLHMPNSFGNYRRLRKIGEGSSAIVSLVQNVKTEEIYACKAVSRKLLVECHLFLRFEQEVRILQSLNHPNIVKIIDVVYEEENIYLIMEYCAHGELFSYVVDNGRMSEAFARKIFIEILEGIKYIHSKGIAHRDIKPENVLLDENMHVKITDFGLCHSSAQFLLKTPCGSPYYAPPEVVQGVPYDGFKGDVWSMGVMLFAISTGALPWTDLQQPGLFKQILSGKIHVPFELTSGLADLLYSMINVNPDERPTVDEMLNHPWVREDPEKIYELFTPTKISHPRSKLVSKSSNNTLIEKPQSKTVGPNKQTFVSKKTILVKPPYIFQSNVAKEAPVQAIQIENLIRKVPSQRNKRHRQSVGPEFTFKPGFPE